MSDELIHQVSEGGVAARHPEAAQLTAQMGPATQSEHNNLIFPIIPVACWRLEHIRFEFDSSFVGPGIKIELKHLSELLDDHPPASRSGGKPGFPLSVFGHADPEGNDDYNKQLSGRRATSIYALLTRDVTLWEKLFSQPLGHDKWGKPALKTMLDTVSPPAPGVSNEPQISELEQNAGKRKELFGRYMAELCGPDLKLAKQDFLGHGDDADGKGDFQGCGEFNPVTLSSQQDETNFENDEDKTARNKANEPNRRVVVLIFRKGSRVDPSKWPCPRVAEGTGACKKRFWSDGEERRSARLPDTARQFEQTKDTFACRFYTRLVQASPCEITLKTFEIRLYNPMAKAIPLAPCTIAIGDRKPLPDKADERGIIILHDVAVPAACHIEWGFPPADSQKIELIFSLDLFLIADGVKKLDRTEEGKQKLNNLGYNRPDGADNIRSFQRDYGGLVNPRLVVSGELDDQTMTLLRRVYAQSADELKKTNVD
jgi:outer membrane protein OmpA-like peptidoglycan-associated protein